jgi:hypothetical protein
MKNNLVFCERCGAKLAEHRNGEYNIVWLELDQRTGTYTDKGVPAEFSQGGFPFGKDCAKVVLAEHESAQHRLAERQAQGVRCSKCNHMLMPGASRCDLCGTPAPKA